MKRNIFALVLTLVLVLSLALTGCEKPCEHEWKAADCDDAKTCEICNATEGAPLGHTWKAATCNAPKTCETCNKVEGTALGHSWVAATCEDPKTCSSCKLEEGEALGHTWTEATTEAPKTCTTCSKTEGDAIDVDDRFTTANCKELFGSWIGKYSQHMDTTGMYSDLCMTLDVTMTFSNDGVMTLAMAPNPDTYHDEMKAYTLEVMYKTFEQQGMDKAAADAAMLSTYGMSMDEYVEANIPELDVDATTVKQEQVYYVQDGKIYAGTSWNVTMAPEDYTLVGNTLTISDEDLGMTLVMTKVEK